MTPLAVGLISFLLAAGGGQAPALRVVTGAAGGGQAPALPVAAGGAPATPADAASAFEAANARYLMGDFEGASRGFEQIVEAGFASAPLLYNLGNAYLRSGRTGWAILSYERALRIAPGEPDVLANLELARGAAVDRVVGTGDEPFLDRLLARLSGTSVTAAFAAVWLALWGLLLARRRALGPARSLLGAAALAAALLATGSGVLLALKARFERLPHAVVVARLIRVREAPQSALRPAFELHEGTKVRVLEASDDYLRVRLANGLEGWVARADVVVI